MELDDVKAEASRLSVFAHLATVGADGKPDVVPVFPAWEGDTVWVATSRNSVKARNIGANPNVALHWQVDESGDAAMLWGTARVVTDLDTKRRLWTGLWDYSLDDFMPGGPEGADNAFLAIEPERALTLKQYGMAGRDTWTRA